MSKANSSVREITTPAQRVPNPRLVRAGQPDDLGAIALSSELGTCGPAKRVQHGTCGPAKRVAQRVDLAWKAHLEWRRGEAQKMAAVMKARIEEGRSKHRGRGLG